MTSQAETVIRCMVCDDFEGPIFEFTDEIGTFRVCLNCRDDCDGEDLRS